MAKRIIYKDHSGKRVPSVTTILSRFKDSGGLIYWANQQGLDGLTLEEARNKPARAGQLAHDLVEAHINGWDEPELTGSDEMIRQARNALANFLNWQEQSRIEFKHTEVSLVSNDYRFGGRLDAIGMQPDGRLALVDFKTGPLYGEHLLQCAAYTLMWNENFPESPVNGGAHLISFRREKADFGHHYFGDLLAEKDVFIQMRTLYGAVKRVEKRAK